MANSNEHEERVPFSDPMFNRGYEIVKSPEPNNDNFNYDDEDEKNIIKPIVSVIVVGIIGYFGFNYLQQDTKKDIAQPNITKEITDTQTVKEDVNIKNEEKEIIESVIKEKKEPQITPTPIVEKVEKKVIKEEKVVKKEKVEEKVEKVKEKATAIEKTEPKVVTTPVTKKVNKIENIDEMKAKVIKTLVQKSKHKNTAKHKNITKKVTKPKKTKKPQYRIVTIKKGDTLASISKRFYGNPMKFKRIIRANRDIKSASTQLHLGQKIIVPIIKSKKTEKKVTNKRRMVTVRKGDTLAIIAKRFYGDSSKYKKIVNANYKIKNEHTPLHIGQKIYVPR